MTIDWTTLAAVNNAPQTLAAVDRALAEDSSPHRLFDLRLLKKKQALGAPLWRVTSFDDVPAEHRNEFEAEYVAAAKEAGERFIERGKFREAFIYLRAVRETSMLAAALERQPAPTVADDQSDEMITLALQERVHPELGLKWMLKTHGTCSSITATDQQFPSLTSPQRSGCAAVLVHHLYEELTTAVRRDVQRRQPMVSPKASLVELMALRDTLFAEGGYHVDVSHLHSVVRLARSLEPAQRREMQLARELAHYGSRLADSLRYPGDPPFLDFYPAHVAFFDVLLDHQRDQNLQYFQTQLERDDDPREQALVAYVLVDLLVRSQRKSEAIPLAEKYLCPADEDFLPAFAELCRDVNDWATLERVAQSRDDVILWTAARLARVAAPQPG